MESDPFALPAFILSIISFAVALLGAATGVTALIWQIVTRTRGAHRVTVEANSNMRIVGTATSRGPYVQVIVRNKGAAPVELDQWSIDKGDGMALVVIPAVFPPQPTLPHMLAAGSSVSFYVLASELKKSFDNGDSSNARPMALLATGQRARGRRGQITFQ